MMWDVLPPNDYLVLLGSNPTFTPYIVGYSVESNTVFPLADVNKILTHIFPTDSNVTTEFNNFLTRNGININPGNASANIPAFIVFAFIGAKHNNAL